MSIRATLRNRILSKHKKCKLPHLVQHFATFSSLNVEHKKHGFLFCKMIPVYRDIIENPNHISS